MFCFPPRSSGDITTPAIQTVGSAPLHPPLETLPILATRRGVRKPRIARHTSRAIMADINNDVRRHSSDANIAPKYGLAPLGRHFGFSIALRLPIRLRNWRNLSTAAIRSPWPVGFMSFFQMGRGFFIPAMAVRAVRPRLCAPSARYGCLCRRGAAAISLRLPYRLVDPYV